MFLICQHLDNQSILGCDNLQPDYHPFLCIYKLKIFSRLACGTAPCPQARMIMYFQLYCVLFFVCQFAVHRILRHGSRRYGSDGCRQYLIHYSGEPSVTMITRLNHKVESWSAIHNFELAYATDMATLSFVLSYSDMSDALINSTPSR